MTSARFHAVRDAQNDISEEQEENLSNVEELIKNIKSAKKENVDENSDTDEEEEHLKPVGDEIEDEEDEDKEDEDDKEIDENLNVKNEATSLTFVCEALGDFTSDDSSDFSFSKGDLLTVLFMQEDGWWQVESQDGQKGLVPSTFLKVPEKIQKCIDSAQSVSQPEEKDNLWSKLRNTVKQAHALEETLSAIGALPVSFCESSLAHLLQQDSRYTTEAFLSPKLSETGLSFKDLKWCNDTNSLKPMSTRLQRVINLVAFRHILPPGPGYEVTSHHVRICLHDGSKVLSNIHTVRALCDPKAPKIWTFTPKVTAGSCLEEGQIFIRSNSSSTTIGVLFQLCVSIRKPDSDVTAEMSCGWVFMRLLDDSGLSVPNRSKILHVQHGVPFQNQHASPTGSREGVLKQFINKSKQPRLVVVITTLKRKTDQLLTYLPSTLIGGVSSIPLIVFYRKILCDKLLKERTTFYSTELIQSPFICNFPKMFAQPDVLDAFRKLWLDKMKKFKQSVVKNEELKKKYFEQFFTETAFLIMQCSSLPEYSIDNHQTRQLRKSEITRIMKLILEHGPLAFSLSSDYRFRPLCIKNLSFDIINKTQLLVNGVD